MELSTRNTFMFSGKDLGFRILVPRVATRMSCCEKPHQILRVLGGLPMKNL